MTQEGRTCGAAGKRAGSLVDGRVGARAGFLHKVPQCRRTPPYLTVPYGESDRITQTAEGYIEKLAQNSLGVDVLHRLLRAEELE